MLVLHNTVQNTSDVENQMRFLAWTMDSLAADMHGGIEKYLVIIHLWWVRVRVRARFGVTFACA